MDMNTEDKSTLPNGVRIAIAITTLVSVLVAFNQCTVMDSGSGKNTKRSTASTNSNSSTVPTTNTSDSGDTENDSELPDGLVMPPSNAPSTPSELDEIDVGVKDFEMINASMSAMTGIPMSDGTIANVYKEITVQMPTDNNVKSFLPANQVAITKLAAEYCEKLVETADKRTAIWGNGINFGGNPPAVFSATNKKFIIDTSMAKFMPPMDSATQTLTYNELSRLFDELLTGEATNTSVTTRKVIKGMCISTLASAHATLL